MLKRFTVSAALAAALAAPVTPALAHPGPIDREAWQPGLVLGVRGSWDDGFVVRLRTHTLYTPTWSEVKAECLEYRRAPRKRRLCLRNERLMFHTYAHLKRERGW